MELKTINKGETFSTAGPDSSWPQNQLSEQSLSKTCWGLGWVGLGLGEVWQGEKCRRGVPNRIIRMNIWCVSKRNTPFPEVDRFLLDLLQLGDTWNHPMPCPVKGMGKALLT